MSTCRSCDAPIEWVFTEKGKRMPIDAAPSANGNLVKVSARADEHGMTPIVHYLRADEETTKDRYTSHFATCEQASKWRNQ